MLEVNLAAGKAKNMTSGKIVTGIPLPESILSILAAGGLMPKIIEIASKFQLEKGSGE